jgi:Protein of unknown function (DUF 659)
LSNSLYLILSLSLLPLVFLCCFKLGTKRLVEGKKKDAAYIASLFDPWVQKLDPRNSRVDCVFFDGASNVQLAGQLLSAKYPRIHVQTCAAHSVSLFFSDVCKKLWQFRLMLVNYRRLFRLFGSGSMHSPYALFCSQSKNFNDGRKVGLLRAAETRMAGHMYAQIRMLQLRRPLVATISSVAYLDLKLKGFPKKVEAYILNPDMWQAAFVIQRCLFPMIKVLRLGDKSECGGMSKLVFYVHQTDKAIQKSMELLKDLKYFRTAQPSDANDVEGIDLDDGEDSDDDAAMDPVEDDDDTATAPTNPDIETPKHLGEQVLEFWEKRKQKLITPLSIAGWFCSPEELIRRDVVANATGAHRLEVESVIAKIYFPIRDEDLGVVLETFWRQYDEFQTKQPPHYSRAYIWTCKEVESSPHKWHKMYSIPHASVFGYVACRVTSKPLGCGGAERTWGAFKHLKNGKRSHMSAERSERQATVYGASCIEKGRAMRAVEEKHGLIVESRWTDADITFQKLAFDNWVLNDDLEVEPEPKRLFKAWIEDDWEWECIEDKKDLKKMTLLRKYQGMQWMDDEELMVARSDTMEWQGGRSGSGWLLIGRSDRDGRMQSYILHEVIDLIAEHVQPTELNVEVVVDAEKRAKNIERMKNLLEEKKAKAVEKRKAAELRKLTQL